MLQAAAGFAESELICYLHGLVGMESLLGASETFRSPVPEC